MSELLIGNLNVIASRGRLLRTEEEIKAAKKVVDDVNKTIQDLQSKLDIAREALEESKTFLDMLESGRKCLEENGVSVDVLKLNLNQEVVTKAFNTTTKALERINND